MGKSHNIRLLLERRARLVFRLYKFYAFYAWRTDFGRGQLIKCIATNGRWFPVSCADSCACACVCKCVCYSKIYDHCPPQQFSHKNCVQLCSSLVGGHFAHALMQYFSHASQARVCVCRGVYVCVCVCVIYINKHCPCLPMHYLLLLLTVRILFIYI